MEFDTITSSILDKCKDKNINVIAIDGRCASGKSTLANDISNKYDCNIIHMDDFFLTSSQRLDSIYKENYINIDYKRFISEILVPLKDDKVFSYKAWDCKKDKYKDSLLIDPNKLTIVEGVYSCHPLLGKYYDLSIFLDVNHIEQINRLILRGSDIKMFMNKWIPLEEEYFNEFDIANRCYLYYLT